ncbi:Glycosyltransferase involved in cell wall bisynthesis [Haloplanus vescus]|uniref:Glycosyltransferase involved in cell wall bisynthesis n=1 Tax=Haloplanus vescus TaxID=555874 RepID=A0A1H4AR97_9EURY|nr:glycosyltransferase [Haloplanus vescus]SEA38361.1 Glycosyltransferase involved in cell wall bisynthesis [Haloplanus vescus]
MHLTQVAPYVTYPPRLGGDHRTHGLVKEFPQHGDTVTRFCQGGSPAMYKSLDLRRTVEIAERYTEYRHLHPLHELLKAPMLVGYPNVFQGQALSVASDGLGTLLADADVVLAREPWQTPYVLDHVDESTPVVFSSHNVETERFGDIDQPLFEGWVERRVDALERRSVEGADAIVCTSERDANVYRETYDPGGPILVAPNGTYEDDLRDHRPDTEAATRVRRRYGISPDATVCLFMGSNYKPNVEAAETVVDVAREFDASVHFLVMGTVGNALEEAALPANVTTAGYVEDDFEAHFDATDIALNPMQSGGGTNIKLIDYFARSLPVVSTPFGARGLDATPDEHLVVAECDALPAAIRRLADAPERRRTVGTNARELAASTYTWEASSRKLRRFVVEKFGPF